MEQEKSVVNMTDTKWEKTYEMLCSLQFSEMTLNHLIKNNSLNQVNSQNENFFLRACKDKKTNLLRKLAHAGIETNITDKNNCTPLILAIITEDEELLSMLLALKKPGSQEPAVDPNFINSEKEFPLYYVAVKFQKLKPKKALRMATELIKFGANVNMQNAQGQTLLFVLARFPLDQTIVLIEEMANYHINPNIVDNEQNTFFRYFLDFQLENDKENLQRFYNFLSNKGFNFDFIICEKSYLMLAVIFNNLPNFKMLLEHCSINLLIPQSIQADPSDEAKKQNKLNVLLQIFYYEIEKFQFAQLLINKMSGGDFNIYYLGCTALHYAIMNCDKHEKYQSFVFQMIEKGADISLKTIEENNWFHLASMFGFLELIQKFAPTLNPSDFTNTNVYGFNALHWAVNDPNGQRKIIVEYILKLAKEKKIENYIDTVIKNRTTTLPNLYCEELSIKRENFSTLEALSSQGFIAKRSHFKEMQRHQVLDGSSALMIATQHQLIDSIEILLKEGADPLLQRDDGYSPLSFSILVKSSKITQLFVQHLFNRKEISAETADILAYSHELNFTMLLKENSLTEHIKRYNYRPLPFELHISETKSESGRTIALQHMTKEELIEHQQNKKQEIVEESNNNAEKKEEKSHALTWFSIIPFNRVNKIYSGSPNCFSCIYFPALPKYISDEEKNEFVHFSQRFTGEHGPGMKEVAKKKKGQKFFTNIRVNGKEINVPITYKVKIAYNTARLYCIEILSDQGRGTLLIGFIYFPPNLHNRKTHQLLQEQKDKIHDFEWSKTLT